MNVSDNRIEPLLKRLQMGAIESERSGVKFMARIARLFSWRSLRFLASLREPILAFRCLMVYEKFSRKNAKKRFGWYQVTHGFRR
jgi:hypothetical protein